MNPTNRQIMRHAKMGLSLQDLVIRTLEDARECILRDENTAEELVMSKQISTVLDRLAKERMTR